MSREGSHCPKCHIGLIVGGHCNNSKCLSSPFYTPGGRKSGNGKKSVPSKKKGSWSATLFLLIIIVVIFAFLNK
ncbi:hypothetical protein BDK62_1178 [Halomonas alkaliantarctica]|jgi:uncharacterized membrane protein YvbJ|nr:hypothetical protein BDK62_1178 [Halomonas alkaliantarctica]